MAQEKMDGSNRKQRVCVIGAGPSGMSTLYYFAKLGDSSPEVTCYERCATWGGQWNLTWRTDTYETGERVTSGMYRTMWINGPKETVEIPHYTFEKHFGKNIPSFFTAPVMLDYLEGTVIGRAAIRTKKIRFNAAVTSVKYNTDTDDFTVITRDLTERRTNPPKTFSYVVVGTGNYSYPNTPEFKGFDTFPGRIMHSQQFRGGHDFKGKRVLVIGAALSAEDMASQCYKYGASHVIVTWRTHPLGYKFPEGIEERPLLQEVNGKVVTFKDGSTAEVDVIALCTGYCMDFPFLEDSLRLAERLTCPNLYKGMVWLGGGNNKLLYLGIWFTCRSKPHRQMLKLRGPCDNLKLTETLTCPLPSNLYKGMVWLGGGDNKLLYLGMVYVPVQTPQADAQAAWAVRYITGINPVHPEEKVRPGLNVDEDTVQAYLTKMKETFTVDPLLGMVGFCGAAKAYLQDIVDDVGHFYKPNEMLDEIVQTFADRTEDVLEFRNKQFASIYTGTVALPPKTKWIENFGDNVYTS